MYASQFFPLAICDVRDACALALSRVIEAIDTTIGGQRIKFNHVFDEWPTQDDKYDPPAACVIAPPEWEYSDSGEPKLLEDTVQSFTTGADDPPSYGLYKTAEMLDQFGLQIRAGSAAMRSMLKLAVEDAFQLREAAMYPLRQRYGLQLDLPEYWGLTARASLLKGSNTDSEDAAMRNQREASFVISMQAPKVQLMAIWPMSITVTEKTFTGDGRLINSATIKPSDDPPTMTRS